MRRPSPLVAIFLTIFLDMLAFGMAIPDLQLRGESLGARGLLLGLIQSSFSIAQFFTAPILGRWSDSAGRKPVLLFSTLLSLGAFISYGFAFSIPMMFLSRILGGIGGANIGVAFAYIADVTKPEERAKGMGILGAAFGLGFIFGPVLGYFLVEWGGGGPGLLGLVGSLLCLLNFTFIWFAIQETSTRRQPASRSVGESVRLLGRALRTPTLGTLILLYFSANFAFSNLEATFFRLIHAQYGMQREGAFALAWVGITAAIIQGGLIGRLAKRFGELNLMRFGYAIQSPTLAMVPFLPPWIPMLIGCTFLAIGTGIANPSTSSLVTQNAPPDMQGSVSGVIQSAGALARMLGPSVASLLFEVWAPLPYLVAAGLMIIPVALALSLKSQMKAEQEGGGILHPTSE